MNDERRPWEDRAFYFVMAGIIIVLLGNLGVLLWLGMKALA